MRIYVASNWASQVRMQGIKFKLEEMGHEVCSGWLEEDNAQAMSTLTPKKMKLYSHRDLGEIMTADLLIIDTGEESNTGGREVEYGVALALGKLVWVVGPVRNIFHSVPRHQFNDWGLVFAHLARCSK